MSFSANRGHTPNKIEPETLKFPVKLSVLEQLDRELNVPDNLESEISSFSSRPEWIQTLRESLQPRNRPVNRTKSFSIVGIYFLPTVPRKNSKTGPGRKQGLAAFLRCAPEPKNVPLASQVSTAPPPREPGEGPPPEVAPSYLPRLHPGGDKQCLRNRYRCRLNRLTDLGRY